MRWILDDLVERRAQAIWANLREKMRASLGGDEERGIALREESEDGLEAQRFLESRLVQTFMARVESNLIQRLTELPVTTDKDMERLRLSVSVQTVRQLQSFMLNCASTGRMAVAELEKLERGGKARAFF